ncbi:MAG: transporter associated domain-containing protein, partial [Brevundimonas sp.]|nr:transporter associated domain-containing protein [Brevundimonas sp.]
HLRSLFAAYEKTPAALVRAIMREPLIVADVMTVPRLWQTLRTEGQRSAMVINEYGSFTGLVTLEDALEEVFGEVQDEFDDEEELVVAVGPHLSVRGDVRVSMLEERHDLILPQDRADTLSGLVWHELGRMPVAGDRIAVSEHPFDLVVEAMDGHAVRRVRVERKPEEDPA